jgi:hypothetical protein
MSGAQRARVADLQQRLSHEVGVLRRVHVRVRLCI